MRQIAIVSILLAAMAPFAAATAQSDGTQEYRLFTVKREQTQSTVDIAGTVTARTTVELTAQLPGRVDWIAGQEGDAFRRGDVLLQIDDSAWQAKLDAAVASRESAISAIRNAQVQLNRELTSPQSRASSQAPGGMGMPSMMDQMFTNPMQNMMGMRNRGAERSSDLAVRENALAQANTQLKHSEAQIKEIRAILRDTKSIAPFDGVIETLHVEQGDTVQPGQPMITYSEASAFQVQADVPQRLRAGLVEGMRMAVKLDGTPPAITATISRIFPTADPTQHTVRIEMDLPPGTPATAGQYAEVSVPDQSAAQRAELVIPGSAVIRRGGMPLVFAVGPEGRARLRVVRLGEAVDQGLTVVLSGIREGDRVVDDPPPGLRGGMLVDPAAAPEASARNNR